MKKFIVVGVIAMALIAGLLSFFAIRDVEEDAVFYDNVEALADDESPEGCTSPKTWLGLGHCMNMTSVICKDNTGNCD